MTIILDSKADFQILGNLIQFRLAAQRFHALLHVLLGANHTLIAEHQVFIQQFLQNDYVLSLISTRSLTVPMPALLARYHHLKVSSWFLQQSTTDTHETPFKISSVFVDIQQGNSWEPPCPLQYRTLPSTPDTLISVLTDTPPTFESLPDERIKYPVHPKLETYRLRSVDPDPEKSFKTSDVHNYCRNNTLISRSMTTSSPCAWLTTSRACATSAAPPAVIIAPTTPPRPNVLPRGVTSTTRSTPDGMAGVQLPSSLHL